MLVPQSHISGSPIKGLIKLTLLAYVTAVRHAVGKPESGQTHTGPTSGELPGGQFKEVERTAPIVRSTGPGNQRQRTAVRTGGVGIVMSKINGIIAGQIGQCQRIDGSPD